MFIGGLNMNLSKIVLILIALWGAIVIVLGLAKLQIFFPFNITDAEAIPYHRWQAVRFATFASIIYFIIKYLIGGRPESALLAISVYFRFLVLFGAILMWQANVDANEWYILGFFVVVNFILYREMKTNPRQRHW